ncbi:MAG: TIGR00341 family protein [Candidatus Njordarchaeia archaeon]
MKSVFIVIPNDKSKIVESILENLDFPKTKIVGEENVIYIVTLSDELVEMLTNAIQKVGVGKIYGLYQIIPLEFAASHDMKEETGRIQRASREEILESIKNKAKLTPNYIAYSILASIIASLGLLIDNIVMIIASMIIAPFIGPIIGLSLGASLDIKDLFDESFKSEAIGLLLSILIGFITTMFTPYTKPTQQILLRANPTYMDLLFALTAGLAAVLSIVSIETMTLIGVAIAASLVPPAANVGIGIAFLLKGTPGAEAIIIGSFLLLTINILAINTVSLLLFWIVGIAPSVSLRKRQVVKKKLRTRIAALTVLLLVFSIPIFTLTVRHYREVSMEKQITNSITKFMEENYPNVEIQSLKVSYNDQTKAAEIHMTIAYTQTNYNITDMSKKLAEYITYLYNIHVRVYISVLVEWNTNPITQLGCKEARKDAIKVFA